MMVNVLERNFEGSCLDIRSSFCQKKTEAMDQQNTLSHPVVLVNRDSLQEFHLNPSRIKGLLFFFVS